jgi:hypothetical protein
MSRKGGVRDFIGTPILPYGTRLFAPGHAGLLTEITAGKLRRAMAIAVLKGATGITGIVVIKSRSGAHALTRLRPVETIHGKIVGFLRGFSTGREQYQRQDEDQKPNQVNNPHHSLPPDEVAGKARMVRLGGGVCQTSGSNTTRGTLSALGWGRTAGIGTRKMPLLAKSPTQPHPGRLSP